MLQQLVVVLPMPPVPLVLPLASLLQRGWAGESPTLQPQLLLKELLLQLLRLQLLQKELLLQLLRLQLPQRELLLQLPRLPVSELLRMLLLLLLP